jgi:glycosyltransferase involved in cell wall biosynthesis
MLLMPMCNGLRLLIVGTYPPPFGGIATHLTMLIPGLKRMGAEDIAVVSFNLDECNEQRDGFRMYRFNVKRQGWRLLNPLNWPVVMQSLRAFWAHRLGVSILARECIKAVLIDGVAKRHRSKVACFYQCDLNMELLPLGRVWKGERATVLMAFGELYERHSGHFMTRHKRLFKDLISVPSAVASSSCHCARSFAVIGVTREIEPVYFGVELSGATSAELRSSFRAERGIGPEDIVVLFMGRFTKEMGLDVLVKAAPTLLGRNSAVRLLIAGARGDHSGQAKELAAAHPDRVFVMENVPFKQQAAIYSASDLLVAPSFNQRACMGLAIKEAMAARLPVVGGAGGGVPEAVVDGETGYLVPLDADGTVDAAQFVERVMKLVDERDTRVRLGNNGRRRAEQLFSSETTNRRMAELFMSAATSVGR